MAWSHFGTHLRYQMKSYIIKRNKTYYYRRRVPKNMLHYFEIVEYKKVLSSDLDESKHLADLLSSYFSKALLSIKLGLEPDLSQLITTVKVLPINKFNNVRMNDLIEPYLASLNIGENRLKAYRRILDTAMIITANKISIASLDKLKATLPKMPRRNIEIYRTMPIKQMLNQTFPSEVLVSLKNVNEYLTVLNSMLKFAYERGMTERLYNIKKYKITGSVRDERKALSVHSIKNLINTAKRPELALAYRLLYFTGMRISEAYKCSISIIDGVECFDLTDRKLEFKTESSRRLIPVHNEISDAQASLDAIRSMKLKYVSDVTNKILTTKGESLYSLRHSFSTELIKADVLPEIVSELMGHAHSTMTLKRYTKGFDINTLRKSINTLSLHKSN